MLQGLGKSGGGAIVTGGKGVEGEEKVNAAGGE
jgi:hypothetical protein